MTSEKYNCLFYRARANALDQEMGLRTRCQPLEEQIRSLVLQSFHFFFNAEFFAFESR